VCVSLLGVSRVGKEIEDNIVFESIGPSLGLDDIEGFVIPFIIKF
jgi:hypothetical protein